MYKGHWNKLYGLHKDQAALEFTSAKADLEKSGAMSLLHLLLTKACEERNLFIFFSRLPLFLRPTKCSQTTWAYHFSWRNYFRDSSPCFPSPRQLGDSCHSPQLLLYLKRCPHRTSNVSENCSRKHTEKEKFDEERQEVVKYKEENRNKEDNAEFPSAASPPTHTPFFKVSKLKTFLITKKNTFKQENKMYFS